VVLPADSHVHTEWSWDAPDGSMERTCARAVEIGLPAIAFYRARGLHDLAGYSQ
jgi:histidinol-phosphatase (PHP family)